MYKPNFCADCGSKVIRARWHAWTSRRFCPDCEGRFRKARFLAPLLAGALLLSIGIALGRATRPQPPPLTLVRGEVPVVTDGKTQTDAGEGSAETDGSSPTAPKPEPKYGPNGTATERPTDPEEVVSICGARTQKGTPCQRRVRGTGRCWQHRGLPAILPPEKLVVAGN